MEMAILLVALANLAVLGLVVRSLIQNDKLTQRMIRQRETAHNAQISELTDKLMALKGYREYAPVPEIRTSEYQEVEPSEFEEL